MSALCLFCRICAGLFLVFAVFLTGALLYAYLKYGPIDPDPLKRDDLHEVALSAGNIARCTLLYIAGILGIIAGEFWKLERWRVALACTIGMVAAFALG